MEVFDNRKGINLKTIELKATTKSVSLSNCGISSLDGFPSHAKLEKLQLMDNKISSVQIFETNSFPELKFLDLSNNRIASLNDLQPLKALPALQHLNLMQNKICSTKGFRNEIFKMFPNLISLDGTNSKGEEVPDSDSDDGDEDEDEDEDYESDESEDAGAEAESVGKSKSTKNGDAGIENDEEDDDEEDEDDEDAEEEEDEDEEDEVGDDDGPGLKFLIEGDIEEDSEGDEDYTEGEAGRKRKASEVDKASTKLQDARLLLLLLKTINYSQTVICMFNDRGARFTVETSKSAQSVAHLPKSFFQHYNLITGGEEGVM
ncbi:Acidic leucine-rich nuclear phosphoprotein 32 member B [Dinochytrium kinnereticum]|nr:Acidic leucine-rich nuclear phosphoprotein 32 member B [Dinochytrium kinnereticum]